MLLHALAAVSVPARLVEAGSSRNLALVSTGSVQVGGRAQAEVWNGPGRRTSGIIALRRLESLRPTLEVGTERSQALVKIVTSGVGHLDVESRRGGAMPAYRLQVRVPDLTAT